MAISCATNFVKGVRIRNVTLATGEAKTLTAGKAETLFAGKAETLFAGKAETLFAGKIGLSAAGADMLAAGEIELGTPSSTLCVEMLATGEIGLKAPDAVELDDTEACTACMCGTSNPGSCLYETEKGKGTEPWGA